MLKKMEFISGFSNLQSEWELAVEKELFCCEETSVRRRGSCSCLNKEWHCLCCSSSIDKTTIVLNTLFLNSSNQRLWWWRWQSLYCAKEREPKKEEVLLNLHRERKALFSLAHSISVILWRQLTVGFFSNFEISWPGAQAKWGCHVVPVNLSSRAAEWPFSPCICFWAKPDRFVILWFFVIWLDFHLWICICVIWFIYNLTLESLFFFYWRVNMCGFLGLMILLHPSPVSSAVGLALQIQLQIIGPELEIRSCIQSRAS